MQNELSQELKLQELQDSLKKVEKAGMQNLSPELKASMDELKDAAESLKRSYQGDSDNKTEPAHTIHNPLVTDPEAIHDGVTPAEAAAVASSPAAVPEPVVAVTPPVAQPVVEPVKQPVASPFRQPQNLLWIKPQRLTNLVAIVKTWLLKIPNPLSVI